MADLSIVDYVLYTGGTADIVFAGDSLDGNSHSSRSGLLSYCIAKLAFILDICGVRLCRSYLLMVAAVNSHTQKKARVSRDTFSSICQNNQT